MGKQKHCSDRHETGVGIYVLLFGVVMLIAWLLMMMPMEVNAASESANASMEVNAANESANASMEVNAASESANASEDNTSELTAADVKEYELWVGGVQVTGANAADVLGNGSVKYEPDPSDDAKGTLTLNNANITDCGTQTCYIFSINLDITLKLIGDNRLGTTTKYVDNAISIDGKNGSLTIEGDGSLNAVGRYFALFVQNSLTVKDATITVEATDNNYNSAIYAGDAFTINGGTVTAKAKKSDLGAIMVTGGFVINDSVIFTPNGGKVVAGFRKDMFKYATITDSTGRTAAKEVEICHVNAVAAKTVTNAITMLPEGNAVTTEHKAAIEAARAAYDALMDAHKKKISAETLQKLTDAEAALKAAEEAAAAAAEAEAKAKATTTVTVNSKTVNASTIAAAITAAGGSTQYVKTLVIGKRAKKISARAFKGTNITTLTIKSKKLKKKSVKKALKGSKVKTVKVQVGNKKTNKKYVKKYKKIFTKKIVGKKVKVK